MTALPMENVQSYFKMLVLLLYDNCQEPRVINAVFCTIVQLSERECESCLFFPILGAFKLNAH